MIHRRRAMDFGLPKTPYELGQNSDRRNGDGYTDDRRYGSSQDESYHQGYGNRKDYANRDNRYGIRHHDNQNYHAYNNNKGFPYEGYQQDNKYIKDSDSSYHRYQSTGEPPATEQIRPSPKPVCGVAGVGSNANFFDNNLNYLRNYKPRPADFRNAA
ncbi:hypothetical protein BV898_15821 [Hypsibius exemplaris]|uniref:Uncharacterized protein n=1 Tax=Hypsibius exemplaris TaxID=2072580 RepID=A0A9X6RKQ1_HYPEX|nr:hypothetical protein BV898_15821 [Hypsibius exemplaris]